MPWTVDDVDGFKKGLSPEQKQRWVQTANNILKGCLASGGSQDVCEKRAISIANSRAGGGGNPPAKENG
jgi:uncharacterized protein YdaT